MRLNLTLTLTPVLNQTRILTQHYIYHYTVLKLFSNPVVTLTNLHLRISQKLWLHPISKSSGKCRFYSDLPLILPNLTSNLALFLGFPRQDEV